MFIEVYYLFNKLFLILHAIPQHLSQFGPVANRQKIARIDKIFHMKVRIPGRKSNRL